MTKSSVTNRARSQTRRWIDPVPVPAELEPLHDHKLVHALLFRRGLTTRREAAAFLGQSSPFDLDGSLVPDLPAAVERIAHAIARRERIGIFGDYDADGVASTALLATALCEAGDRALIELRLPTRSEGYGLSPGAIDTFVGNGVKLLIALDCASSDCENIAYAQRAGLEVIIVDHHQMHDEGPPGALVVSPYRPSAAHYREMSTAGLVWLLVAALERAGVHIGAGTQPAAVSYLDLAAIGLIGDVSPMRGANRAIVRAGIDQIRIQGRPGVAALCNQAQLDMSRLTSTQVAFRISPRLNAAGRMGDPAAALALLTSSGAYDAQRLAAELDAMNTARKIATDIVTVEAEALLRNQRDWEQLPIAFAVGTGWPLGVLGIVAARLVEAYGRPAVVLSDDGEMAKGSARSPAGFDIAAALANSNELLISSGGHRQAAGLTVASDQVDRLRSRLTGLAGNALPEMEPVPSMRLDAELQEKHLTFEIADLIQTLEPFGPENEEPVFILRNVPLRQYQTMGRDNSHLRLTFGNGRRLFKAPFFGAADRSRELVGVRYIDLAFTLSIGEFNGPQLDILVKDFRPAQ